MQTPLPMHMRRCADVKLLSCAVHAQGIKVVCPMHQPCWPVLWLFQAPQSSGCTAGVTMLSHIFATATLNCELDLTASKWLEPLLDPPELVGALWGEDS